MPIYMWQAAYTAEAWAAQLKNPVDRLATMGRACCEALGGKVIGTWYGFGDYDAVAIVEMPNAEAMSALALAMAAGGAMKSAKTTVLMTGAEAVAGMKRTADLAKAYAPPT